MQLVRAVNKAAVQPGDIAQSSDRLLNRCLQETGIDMTASVITPVERWTTYQNLVLWFDIWEKSLIKLGFAQEPSSEGSCCTIPVTLMNHACRWTEARRTGEVVHQWCSTIKTFQDQLHVQANLAPPLPSFQAVMQLEKHCRHTFTSPQMRRLKSAIKCDLICFST